MTDTTSNFGPKVGLFVRCLVDLIRPSIGFAAIKLQEDADLPRVVNWVIGSSRNGDIKQKILHNIHDPRHLHIIIVDEA